MLLFFDDTYTLIREGLTRDYNTPEYIPDSYYRDPCNYAMNAGLPSVFFDDDRQEYIMIYNVLEPKNRNNELYQLAAHSKDAIHWEPCDTTNANIENRRFPNQIFYRLDGEAIVYKDERAPKEERYKLLFCRYAENLRVSDEIYVSPDWLNWEKLDTTWNTEGAEPGLGCFYSSVREAYVITCRPHWAERRVCVTETKDWRTFTPVQLAVQADSIDEPLSVMYGMPTFEYDNYFIGLLWKLFDCESSNISAKGNQIYSELGKMSPELVYSMNGINYQRSLRKPFISNGSPDKPYFGCLFAQTMLTVGDDIYIYAAVSQGEHGGFRDEGNGAIVAFKIKKDRFIYLESNGNGKLLTRNLLVNGDLSVNAHIVGGMKFQLEGEDCTPIEGFTFDDCDTVSGDVTDRVITWHGKTTSELIGKAYSVKIMMYGGRLFALKGDIHVLFFNQTRLFNAYGFISDRKGF